MLPFMAVFPAGAAAASAPSGAACTLSGSLSATGSTSTVTSTARTVTVPVGNSGVLRFEDLVELGEPGVTLRVSVNGATNAPVVDGTEKTFTDTQTITVSIIGAYVTGDGYSFNLIDSTNGSLIGSYSIYRT